MNTKETTEYLTIIRNAYKELINNYAELNIYFDLTNPVEIHMLFVKLLHNGYLSYEDNFQYDTKGIYTYNIKNLLGIDIINGKGVCRHISAMLKDVFNKLEIRNEILPIYLYDDNSKNKLHLSGNHVINLVSQDGKVYFLDPTSGCIWKKIPETNLLTCKNKEIEVARISNWIDILDYNSDNIEVFKNIKQMLLMNTTSKRQDEKMISMVNKLFRNNIDFFEEFKQENKLIYNDIVVNAAKLKTRKQTINGSN